MSKIILFLIVSLIFLTTLISIRSRKVYATDTPQINITQWDYAYQYDGSILNSGEITLELSGVNSEIFPGTGVVYFKNIEGRIISGRADSWHKQTDGTWTMTMYIPGGATTYYYSIYMDEEGLNVPVVWNSYGPWVVNSDNTGIEYLEYHVFPEYSLTEPMISRANKSDIEFSWNIQINPTWPVYKYDRLRLVLENNTCGKIDIPLQEGISHNMPVKKVYSHKEVKPKLENATWSLVYHDAYGNDVVWANGSTLSPQCK